MSFMQAFELPYAVALHLQPAYAVMDVCLVSLVPSIITVLWSLQCTKLVPSRNHEIVRSAANVIASTAWKQMMRSSFDRHIYYLVKLVTGMCCSVVKLLLSKYRCVHCCSIPAA
jgi:hypothetical protein